MSTASFQLRHCCAVITGASSGLGAEFARQLAERGADRLVLVARRLEALEQLRADLQVDRPELAVDCVVADLATDEGLEKVVSAVTALPAPPNLLINNAGMGDYGSFLTASESRLRMQMGLNIGAVVMLTHALLPHLGRTAEQPAGVLNVSSLAGQLPMPELAVYAATKSFVTSFSEALRIELERDHVVVSCVCPGPTPTQFGRNARRADGTDTDRSGQGLLRIPPSRVVERALLALTGAEACAFPGVGVSVAGTVFRCLPRSLMRWMIRVRHRRSLDQRQREIATPTTTSYPH